MVSLVLPRKWGKKLAPLQTLQRKLTYTSYSGFNIFWRKLNFIILFCIGNYYIRMQTYARMYFFKNIRKLLLNTEGSAVEIQKEIINKEFTR